MEGCRKMQAWPFIEMGFKRLRETHSLSIDLFVYSKIVSEFFTAQSGNYSNKRLFSTPKASSTKEYHIVTNCVKCAILIIIKPLKLAMMRWGKSLKVLYTAHGKALKRGAGFINESLVILIQWWSDVSPPRVMQFSMARGLSAVTLCSLSLSYCSFTPSGWPPPQPLTAPSLACLPLYDITLSPSDPQPPPPNGHWSLP